jgi:AraC-like DNA-binding protein
MHRQLSEARALAARNVVDHDTFVRLHRSREFMAAHFDERVTLASAADVAYMSPFHYQRLFCQAFGESPHEFLTRRRLERAQRLLRTSGMTVSEVCVAVGYESLGSFSSMFARQIGCPPTEFRRVYSLPGLWALRSIPGCFMGIWAPRGISDF